MARMYHPRMAPPRTTRPRTIRVVFAEDNYLVREGTAALLATSEAVDLVGTATSRDELLAAVAEHTPDAVLTDIRMPPTGTNEGIEAAKTIRAEHPEIGVVVLSQFADEEYAYELLKDGAAGLGYLLKERVADVDELIRALGEVSRGGSVLDPKVVEALVAAKDRMAHSPLAQLTDREREVLSHMAQGQNNAAIAASLFLTERAVEKHINSMFHKLGLSEEPGVHRRVMAVLAFLRETEHD
jgi:DNA-binding NarL/FixJ family response regulator